MQPLFAQALGFVAMAFCLMSYQIKDSRGLILCKAAGDVLYVLHYLLLGAYSGCVTLVFCAVSGVACSFKGRRAWADWKGWKWLFSALLVAVGLLTWRDSFLPVPNLCSMVSIVTVILTTWTGDGGKIRLGKLLAAGPAWLIYCFAVQSWSGILCELFGMCSAAIGIRRYGLRTAEVHEKEAYQ